VKALADHGRKKYFEGKSQIADFKNTGPRGGGSLLPHSSSSSSSKTPWAHLDIAGTVLTEKENGYNSPGATGYGVRTLVNWVLSNVKSEVAAPPK